MTLIRVFGICITSHFVPPVDNIKYITLNMTKVHPSTFYFPLICMRK